MKKVVVDAGLLIGHLVQGKDAGASTLRQLASASFCYTTVFGAIEAFGACRSEEERNAVERSMNAMKILGLNARSGKNLGALVARHADMEPLHLLAAGVCIESRLPFVTDRKDLFRDIEGLKVLTPEEALRGPATETNSGNLRSTE